jgi:hypothetical protein
LHAEAAKYILSYWINPLKKKQGISEAQLREIKGVLAKGWPVGAGSDHSRLLVGFQDDTKKKGGGIFFVKDSGTGDYEEVDYQFVRSKVGDVFWVESRYTAGK